MTTDKNTAKAVKIIPYNSSYQTAFKTLNETWIKQYFKMETSDYKSLDHPDSYILDKGGYIAVALLQEEAVGVCALINNPHPKYDFELAKMAVAPNMQGLGIGKKLAQAIIQEAQNRGAKWIFLESNTVLAPAIQLYRKLGFTEVVDFESPYERSNICMELEVG